MTIQTIVKLCPFAPMEPTICEPTIVWFVAEVSLALTSSVSFTQIGWQIGAKCSPASANFEFKRAELFFP